MLASDLAVQLEKAVQEHGDYEVLDEDENSINDIELNEDEEDDPVFILTT